MQDFLEAYRLFVATGDARSTSITLQYLSQLYSDARDFKRARTYLQQAVEAYSSDPMLQLSYANTMGNLLVEQGQYPAALTEYQRGLSIARSQGAHSLEQMLLGNLALGQIKYRHLAEASRTIDEATAIAQRTGTGINGDLLAVTARLRFAEGKTALARQILDKIFALPKGQATLDADAEYEAYRIYKAAGALEPALAHLEIAGRLRNAALALGISTQASLMAAQFDFDTQNLRIAALKATAFQREMMLNRQIAARRRAVEAAVAVLILIAMVGLSIWLVALKRSRDRSAASTPGWSRPTQRSRSHSRRLGSERRPSIRRGSWRSTMP